jgi:hypothetical protein
LEIEQKKKEDKAFNARKYMEMAIQIMNKSIQEPRQDKVSPKVGAVLIKPDGVARSLTGEIISRIEAKGYVVTGLKMLKPMTTGRSRFRRCRI